MVITFKNTPTQEQKQFSPEGGALEYLCRSLAILIRGRKENLVPGGYNWTTLQMGGINTETRSSRLRVERKAEDLLLRNPKK
jgi:hypothetical protein